MLYKIAESFDAQEVNHIFQSSLPPTIGRTITVHNKTYTVVDVECRISASQKITACALLKRVH